MCEPHSEECLPLSEWNVPHQLLSSQVYRFHPHTPIMGWGEVIFRKFVSCFIYLNQSQNSEFAASKLKLSQALGPLVNQARVTALKSGLLISTLLQTQWGAPGSKTVRVCAQREIRAQLIRNVHRHLPNRTEHRFSSDMMMFNVLKGAVPRYPFPSQPNSTLI